MTRIESRPRRYELGRYMFFIDMEGADTDPAVAEAIGALRNKAENVRVLGQLPGRAGSASLTNVAARAIRIRAPRCQSVAESST